METCDEIRFLLNRHDLLEFETESAQVVNRKG